MSFPVVVEIQNGYFVASLAGVPNLSVVESTRAQAIAALKEELQRWIERGELLALEVETFGVSDLAGLFSDDPTLREICEQAYQTRDAEIQPEGR
jgi:predicted RNase H-like HicB family nuclease